MLDMGYMILICFAIVIYVITAVAGMIYLWDETQWFEWLKKVYIEDMNIIPITRVIGLLGYCSTIILTPILLPVVLTLVGIGILLVYAFEYISAGICWLILGRTEWKQEKKKDVNDQKTGILNYEEYINEYIKNNYGSGLPSILPDGTYKYFPNGTQYKPAEPVEGIKSDKSIRWGRWQERYNKDNSGTEWYFVPNIPDEEWKHLTHTEKKKLSDEGKKHEKGRFDE
jgi:hypothetical protein